MERRIPGERINACRGPLTRVDCLINPIKGGLQLRILIVERPVRIIDVDHCCCTRAIPSSSRVDIRDGKLNVRRTIWIEIAPRVYDLT